MLKNALSPSLPDLSQSMKLEALADETYHNTFAMAPINQSSSAPHITNNSSLVDNIVMTHGECD